MGRRRRQASQVRKKPKRMVPRGQLHIYATFNNTIVTLTDDKGNTLAWASGGSAGFKGSRKATPYAAGLASQSALRVAQDYGMQEIEIIVKGPGPGRESAIRRVSGTGMRVTAINDITPVPHNGCRPPKKRRV